MPKLRTPLKDLIERNRDDQNGRGWSEFVELADLKKRLERQKDKTKRLSTHSIAVMFNKNDHTVAKWLRRYDEEEK